MGRLTVAAGLALLAGCQREPSFDERFANASATIVEQSAAMDNQMRALEAQDRADEAAVGATTSGQVEAVPPADTTP